TRLSLQIAARRSANNRFTKPLINQLLRSLLAHSSDVFNIISGLPQLVLPFVARLSTPPFVTNISSCGSRSFYRKNVKEKSLSLMTKSHGAVRIVVKGSVSRMEPETSESYDEIDWAVVYERLRVVALHCADRMPDIFDGVSAEDVVTQVLSAYFESSNGLGWNPAIGPLDRFLLRVLRNRTIDRIRRQSRVAGSFDDPDFTNGVYCARPNEPESDEPNDLSR